MSVFSNVPLTRGKGGPSVWSLKSKAVLTFNLNVCEFKALCFIWDKVSRCRRVWTSSDFLRLPPESVPFPFTELLVAKALVWSLICIHLTLTSSASLCWWFHADAALTCSWRYYPLQHGTRITFYYFADIRDQVFGVTFKIGKATWLQFSVCFGNPQEVWVAIPAVVKLTVFTFCAANSLKGRSSSDFYTARSPVYTQRYTQ